MKHRNFYAVGYRRLKFDAFVREILARDLLLVDCRHYPYTGNDWNFHNLTHELDTNYLHVPEFGNKHFREGVLSVNDLEKGIAIVEKQERAVVLMCACPTLAWCHRSLIVAALEARDWRLDEFETAPVEGERTAIQPNLF